MTETTWHPWEMQYADLFESWLKAAGLAGIVQAHKFTYDDLIPMIDNAEKLDLLGDVSREKAILLIGLWMGRYQGNQDTGQWKNKIYAEETEIGQLKEICQDFIDVADDPNSKPFWETVARLLVAVRNLHPDRPEDASGKYGQGARAFWNEQL